MSLFKTRSNYFKSLASNHKLVAHDKFISGNSGPKRKSFFRLNNEDELAAACVNWAHFPCLVHFGYLGRYSGGPAEVDKRNLSNNLLFLAKAVNPIDMDSIEDAKDLAFQVMEEFISWIMNEFEKNGYCSPFQDLSLSDFNFTEYGPVNVTLYGWELNFSDQTFPNNISQFDASNWFE